LCRRVGAVIVAWWTDKLGPNRILVVLLFLLLLSCLSRHQSSCPRRFRLDNARDLAVLELKKAIAMDLEGKDFHHPYAPYDIQLQFMRALYDCIEDGKVGIFESPTGNYH
jgi:hypothetical protein